MLGDILGDLDTSVRRHPVRSGTVVLGDMLGDLGQ